MTRNRIFISYSHKDETLCKEFETHLKSWRDWGIRFWNDRQIQPGQNWHEEIQQAIDTAAVAVLLISPDFMASDYIKKHEIVPLAIAHREEKLALAPLFLRPSLITDSDYVIEIPMENGKLDRMWLAQLQGLNKPDETVAGKPRHRRDTIFSHAVQQLKQLYKRYAREEKSKSPPSDQRHELTIKLKRRDDWLIHSFFNPHEPITKEAHSSWSLLQQQFDNKQHDVLYTILFGVEDKTRQVMTHLFSDSDDPTRYPVRVRIQTDDPVLAELPWTQVRWQGHRLWDAGWTFELIGETSLSHFPDIRLQAPSQVLLIAPQPDNAVNLGCESHLHALEERLDHAWSTAHRPPLPSVETWAQLERTLKDHTPDIIYFYGLAKGNGGLSLQLKDKAVAIEELSRLWSKKPPQVLFLNLLKEQPIHLETSVSPLLTQVPLIITQTWSWTDLGPPRQAAQAWFYTLLQGGENQDPVEALHKDGLYTALAWSRYGRWYYNPQVATARQYLARLLLNREIQRGSVLLAVSQLVRDPDRRVSCVLAYGNAGNRVDLFAEQLLEYLRTHAKDFAHIRPLRLQLPLEPSFSADLVNQQVRHSLDLAPNQSLQDALKHRKPRVPDRTRALLLLDWKTREVQDKNLVEKVVRAWVQFCWDQLCKPCPPDTRLLSVLALQTDEKLYEEVERVISLLSKDPNFINPSFSIVHIPALGDVKDVDLIHFLKMPKYSTCPAKLLLEMVEIILHVTEGKFNKTVEFIETAEQTTWYEMYDQYKPKS